MNAKIIKQEQILKASLESLGEIKRLENLYPFTENKTDLIDKIAKLRDKYALYLTMLFETVCEDINVKHLTPDMIQA